MASTIMRRRSTEYLWRNSGGHARNDGPDSGFQVREHSPSVEILHWSFSIVVVCGLEADGNVTDTLVGMINNQEVSVCI